MSHILQPSARADILAIAKHIAADNPKAALDWYDEILATCGIIGDMPGIGQSRDDVKRNLKTFPKGNYLILFRVVKQTALIIRVIHSARDWPKLMR